MKLVVATWNIHRCVGRDGQRDPDRVAAVLREIGPDIVGLQEVDHVHGALPYAHQAEHLAAALRLRSVAGPTVLRPDGDYGNALLTRWPVTAVRRFDISVRGREPRGVLDARLSVAGRPLRALVTHLGLRAWERDRQVRRLLRDVIGGGDHDTPLVILGDFNVWFGLSRAGWRLMARFGRPRRIATWPSDRPTFALDRIWTRPRRALRHLRAHRSDTARIASDHLPLVGELTLPGPAAPHTLPPRPGTTRP